MMTKTNTTIDLIRHGEISTPGLLCAGTEEALSPRGVVQMEALRSHINWELILSSPYLRCRAYAEKIAADQTCELNVDPVWQEIDFGRWTNQTLQHIADTEKDKLNHLWSSPHSFQAPDGESMSAFIARVQEAFAAVIKENTGKSILILTHAGVIRVLLSQMLAIDYQSAMKFSIGYARVNRFHAYPDGHFSLQHWGARASELEEIEK